MSGDWRALVGKVSVALLRDRGDGVNMEGDCLGR
jgi:hypothetical protein